MNPVPRPMVYTAALALAGVCVLGLYLGIQPNLNRPGDSDETTVPASATPSMKPGMAAAVEATPLKPDALPPSAAPAAQVAQAARPKAAPSDDTDAPGSDALAAGPTGRTTPPPEPPALYSPDEAPTPPPAQGPNNTPPY